LACRTASAAHFLRFDADAWSGMSAPEIGPCRWVSGRRKRFRKFSAGASMPAPGLNASQNRLTRYCWP
jgi:hypothetical protein